MIDNAPFDFFLCLGSSLQIIEAMQNAMQPSRTSRVATKHKILPASRLHLFLSHRQWYLFSRVIMMGDWHVSHR